MTIDSPRDPVVNKNPTIEEQLIYWTNYEAALAYRLASVAVSYQTDNPHDFHQRDLEHQGLMRKLTDARVQLQQVAVLYALKPTRLT